MEQIIHSKCIDISLHKYCADYILENATKDTASNFKNKSFSFHISYFIDYSDLQICLILIIIKK
jgi:uncharacterized membrane protein